MNDYSYLLKDTKLSDAQNQAIEILSHRRSMILSFQAGLGKTTTCLTTAKLYQIRNPNVITFFFFPKSARAAFKKEFQNRLCEEYALYSAEETIEYTNQNYVLCESTYLKKIKWLIDSLAASHPLACFFNEAHCLQDSKTALYKDFYSIKDRFAVFHAVTATPLINSIEGLFTLCNLIDPKNNPRWESFRAKYCVTRIRRAQVKKKNGRKIECNFIEIVGYKNLNILHEYLKTICIQGGITYNINFIYKQTDLDAIIQNQYLTAAAGVFDADEDDHQRKLSLKAYGARLHDLQRIIDGSYCEKITNKTKLLLQALKAINLKGNEASLVYAEYDDTVETIEKFLDFYKEKALINNIYVLSGKTKEEERVRIEKSIEPRDVVIITAAGRQSRNLQRANNLIFYDLPFSVGTITQCIGRICRVDSTFPQQNVYILEVKNTIDTYKRILFKDNLWLIRQLFSGQTTLPTDVMTVDAKEINRMKQSLLWCRNHSS